MLSLQDEILYTARPDQAEGNAEVYDVGKRGHMGHLVYWLLLLGGYLGG